MTRPATNYRDRRRELARELSDVPTPPPPADLLDAIRGEIPADLEAVSGPALVGRRPWWRSRVLALAASLAFVTVGAAIVLRTSDRPRILGYGYITPSGVARETQPISRQAKRPEQPEQAEDLLLAEQLAPRDADRLRSLGYIARAPVEQRTAESITMTSESPMVDKFNVADSRPDVSSSLSPARLRSNAYFRPSSPPSTGGTAEPNEAPVGDMFFRSTGVNPFIDTREDRLSTFAVDVDTGSWSLTRSYLERGSLPPSEAIRVEEFVNAQGYDDPAPRRGDFTLVAEGAPSPFTSPGDYRLLRFAVKGRELEALDRKPAVLTFVVDVSGSMEQENRLGLVKQALGVLIDELRSDDRVGLVVYGTRGRVVLEHTNDHQLIRGAIASLYPEGSTNADEGLRLGYDLAGDAYHTGWNNRVVLCSDGVANVGATGPESILERIGREARRGIELTTVGFGMGNYNDALMEQLADQGNGRYHYVDRMEEARRIFRENLTGTLETIAMDAKVQVELDPQAVERWRLLGYENRDVADRDFRNDRVDAGEIGAGHSATALYEIRLAPGARRNDTVGTLRLRWKSAVTGNVEEAALTLRVRDLSATFDQSSNNLRRAAVAAELAEMLKRSFYAKEASWRTLRAEADRLEPISAPAHEPDALLTMIVRAGELSAERVEESDERDQ